MTISSSFIAVTITWHSNEGGRAPGFRGLQFSTVAAVPLSVWVEQGAATQQAMLVLGTADRKWREPDQSQGGFNLQRPDSTSQTPPSKGSTAFKVAPPAGAACSNTSL